MIKPMNYIANIHFFNELHFVYIWYFSDDYIPFRKRSSHKFNDSAFTVVTSLMHFPENASNIRPTIIS